MKILVDIDDELIADVIDQGSTYGIEYWGECTAGYDYILKVLRTYGLGFGINEVERAWIGGTIHDDKLIACHVVFWQDIQKGLELMAGKWHDALNAMLNGDYDCITGDILLQLTLFGEISYS